MAPIAQASIKVAVASNFSKVAEELADSFAELGNQKPILLFGSSGKHAAQILQGLPVDLLMAADRHRPMLLERKGVTLKGSRTTYALGRLSLLSTEFHAASIGTLNASSVNSSAMMIDTASRILINSERIAIANPKLAPYGEAAKQVIETLGLTGTLSTKLVMGENISQAFQFIMTGNAEVGLVAHSMINDSGSAYAWLLPKSFHLPIEQQMVLLSAKQEAQLFYDFIKSDSGVAIIVKHGYDAPND